MDQNQTESISRPAAAAIAGLAANYFVSNGRRTGNSADENALWLKYVADCAERGASPYGANRKHRRAAASQRRHAAGALRQQAHERDVALTNKLRRAGICDMAFDVARFKRKSAAIDAIMSNFALAT